MKIRLYKKIALCIALGFSVSAFAQKQSKTFKENFKVNKDVKIEINANNAEIDVTTWNKNEVAVDAVITVEGLSKKEADKYLKKWNFEALGNSKKVSVNAKSGNYFYVGDHDFNFNFDMANIVIPDIDIPEINISDFEMPDITIPEIDIPDIKLDLDEIIKEIDDYDFDIQDNDYRNKFTYKINGKKKTTIIKSKKDWEEFKKSKDYKVWVESIKQELKDAQESIKKIDKKKIEEEIRKAKLAVKKINKKELEKSLEIARKSIEKMKIDMSNSFKIGENVIFIKEDGKEKKVKITSKITIKVPKGATFDLNTRHCKVSLPKGKTNGKVSYGSLKTPGINGGELRVSYAAPVTIETLNACSLFLNNVTDAKIASVTNTKLSSNYGELVIDKVNNNTNVSSSFGEISIKNLAPSISQFKLNLEHADAIVNLNGFTNKLTFDVREKSSKRKNDSSMTLKNGNTEVNGNFVVKNSKESFTIESKYSYLVLEGYSMLK